MEGPPVEKAFAAPGARIAYFEWGRAGDPAVLLIHATGFHARCWDEVVRALPPSHHVIAVDVRGHGRSEKTGPIADWRDLGSDIAALVAHLGLQGIVGVGHSMGGHCVVQAAIAHPHAFKRLVLVDPVLMTPEFYAQRFWPEGAEHPVARRRNKWGSWEDLFDAFKSRHPYSLWRVKVLEDYCRYGVQPAAEGGVELACPPAIEASIYMQSTGANLYDRTQALDMPVTILRAKERPPGPRDRLDFSDSPTWPKLATAFKRARDVYLPHLTHFIPMQEPELVARFIAEESATP
jgi:pimeloyl-ACP methyl ester carboxylesterase